MVCLNDEARQAAVDVARRSLHVDPTVPATATKVFWPGRDEIRYFLVEFGRPDARIGVAAVDASSVDLLGSARLPGTGPHLTVLAGEALERAGFPDGETRLEWGPSRQTMSPLYPLWVVRRAGRDVYVDQQGTVWDALETAGPGGSPEAPRAD